MREHVDNDDGVMRLSPEDGPALRWLKVHARYVRLHMGGRALATVWLPGDRKLDVENILALGDTGVVLQGMVDESPVHLTMNASSLSIEFRPAPEGVACTSFAFAGASRTPQPFVARTKTPPPPPPDEGDDGGGGWRSRDADAAASGTRSRWRPLGCGGEQ